MGVVPQGIFNYFARPHGIPLDPTEALPLLLRSRPRSVKVAGVNDRVFLVNASLGPYPDLLEDREAYKAHFGRSRWVARLAGCATLPLAPPRLRVHMEMGDTVRDVQTLTLFVGSHRLQRQRLGAEPEAAIAGTPGDGSMAALMLRPINTLSTIGLLLHGAKGRLGEAAGVERFEFQHMVVKPTRSQGRRGVGRPGDEGPAAALRPALRHRSGRAVGRRLTPERRLDDSRTGGGIFTGRAMRSKWFGFF